MRFLKWFSGRGRTDAATRAVTKPRDAGSSFSIVASPELCISDSFAPDINVIVPVIGRADGYMAALSRALADAFVRRQSFGNFIEAGPLPTVMSGLCVTLEAADMTFVPLFQPTADGSVDLERLRTLTAGRWSDDGVHASRDSVELQVFSVSGGAGIAPVVIIPSEIVTHRDEHCAITARVHWNGVILAEETRPYELSDMGWEPSEVMPVRTFRRIFASYAREDTAVVEALASVIKAFGVGELRWDVAILDAGDDWHETLLREIDTADSFQLFWSAFAAASDNVRREWEYALQLQRKGFVRPVYWVDPLPEPPQPLARLHFAKIRLPPPADT